MPSMDTQVKRGNYFLAAVLAGDAAMSIKPPKFIRDCLNGVNFPKDWWWSLIVIKSLAALGLVRGTAKNSPQMTTATSTGVVAYFACAIFAHVKAKFLGKEFWLNCLGMTALSTTVLVQNRKQRR